MDLRALRRVLAAVSMAITAGFAAQAQVMPTTPELVVQTGHQHQIDVVAFSADSRLVATGDMRGSIRIWEVASAKQLWSLAGHPRRVDRLEFSRDGRWLASVGGDNPAESGADMSAVKVWEVATGTETRSFLFPGFSASDLAITADGGLVAAADDGVHIWKAATGEKIAEIPGQSRTTLAFDPSGDLLAIRNAAQVRFWKPNELEAASIRLSNQYGRRDMVFLANGSRLAVPDGDRILVVDLAKRDIAGRLGADDEARVFGIHNSDRELVVQTGNRYEVWDVTTRRKVRDLAVKFDASQEVPSPSWGWMAKPDGTALHLDDLQAGREPMVLGGHLAAAGAVAFSADGSLLATKTGKRFWLWDLRSGEPRLFDGHRLPGGMELETLSFTGGGRLVSADQYSNILEWDVASGSISNSVGFAIGESTIVHACSAEWCASGDVDHIDVRDVATWRLYRTIDTGIGRAGLAMSDDGAWIATGVGELVPIWHRETGRYRALEGHVDLVTAVAFSPGGRRIAAAALPGNVKLWDVESGRESLDFDSGHDAVRSLAFSPDNRTLATGGYDEAIRLWDPDSGELRHALKGHGDWIAKLAFSPDGRMLASGSADGTIRLWDVDQGKLVALLTAARDSPDWLVVTPEGFFDGSAGADGLVAWRIGQSGYSPASYFNRLFRPGLLANVWRGGVPTSDIEFDKIPVPPVIRLLENGGRVVDDPRLTMQARVEGPVQEVVLYHNGARVAAQPGLASASAEYTFDLDLIAGENELRGIAVSPAGLSSHPDSIRIIYDAPPAKPALHVLTIGVSRYAQPSWNLGFARADAEALAEFFTAQSSKLFEPMSVTVLADEDASRSSIEATLASIGERAQPEDVVLIYFAGHGVAIDETYYMLPHDMRDEVSLEADVRKFGLSDRVLLDSLRKIKALKKVVIIDACQSGGALDILGRAPAAERAALEMLVRAEGLFIIAASTRQQEAIEVPALGHGILTYALLSGLGAKDDATLPDVITMHQLLAYVSQKVPELAARFERTTHQVPVSFSRGMDFPLTVRAR